MSDFFSSLNYYVQVRYEMDSMIERFGSEMPEENQAHYNSLVDLANELAVDVRKYADRFEFPEGDSELPYMSTHSCCYEHTDQPVRYAELAAKMICTDLIRANVKHSITVHRRHEGVEFEIRVKIRPEHRDPLSMRSGTGIVALAKMVRDAGLDPRVFYPLLPDGV